VDSDGLEEGSQHGRAKEIFKPGRQVVEAQISAELKRQTKERQRLHHAGIHC